MQHSNVGIPTRSPEIATVDKTEQGKSLETTHWDDEQPWNHDVRGVQVLPLINLDQPVLKVPAGPGTGKTFGLTRRVLRILHPDGLGVPSDRVLVCTFNRVIAKDLRNAIEKELSPYGLLAPEVKTVHALAASLASLTPRFLLPEEIESTIYDIRSEHPEIDAAYGGKQDNVLRALREHEAGFVDHPMLATAVRSWLTDHHASLVGDLPREVESKIRSGDLSDKKYDHIIIDEFQDLTIIEAQLLFGLCSDNSQLVALGDKKQSIYAFRGNLEAGLDNISQLTSHPVTPISMTECQRCPREIVNLANDVMAIYGEPLVDVKGAGGQIFRIHHDSPEKEHDRLAREIVRVYKARPKDKHLVLTTRRKWGYDLRRAIKKFDPSVNAQTVFSEDILEVWPVREAFLFLSLVGIPNDTASVRDWLSYRQPDTSGKNWKAPKRNAPAYASLKQKYGLLDLNQALRLSDIKETDITGTGRKHIIQRLGRLRTLHDALPKTEDPEDLLNHILDPSLWVIGDSVESEFARDDINRIRAEGMRLIAKSNPSPVLGDIVKQLRYLISTREPIGADEEPAVTIVTLWGAKGLTADFVYLAGLCDEALPGPYKADGSGLTESEHEREQLRLLYVSLTRAKKALVISRPSQIARGQIAALGLTSNPSSKKPRQRLSSVRFFSDVQRHHLPNSQNGSVWTGIDLKKIES